MFTTVEKIKLRWAESPSDEILQATIEDVSAYILAIYEIPDRPSDQLSALLNAVTITVVRRVLESSKAEGLKQETQSAGPFSRSRTYSDSNIYLTSAEKEAIEKLLEREAGKKASGMMTVEAEGW